MSTSTAEHNSYLVENWDTETLIDFLKEQNLKLDDDDFNIIRKKKINGLSFLEMTEEKFERYGLEGGPATLLAKEVQTLKEKPKQHRTFASSNRIYHDINFYVEPRIMIEKFVKFLLEGKFSLLYGHRQSGKSTTAYAVKEWLEEKYNKEVYIITFSSVIVIDRGLNEFWHSVCAKLESLNAERFKYNVYNEVVRASASSSTFESLFSKHNNSSAKDCIIIIDEASYLGGNQEIIDSFISSLRVLKDRRDQFNVFSFMLVGTEIIREFLLTHQKSNSASIISPLSVDASMESSRFSEIEVRMLLFQYCKENNYEIQMDKIAKDIYHLTLGHKGLVGTCCSFLETRVMEGKNILTIDKWNEMTYILPEFIRGKATYESIVRTLPNLSENKKRILAKVLRSKTDVVSYDNPDVKFLLAEGMIVKEQKKEGTRDVTIRCSAPILRNIIIYQITGPNIDLSKNPKQSDALDAKWLLERTIENLCLQHIFTDETSNAGGEPSEYAFQAEFITVIKKLLSAAYPKLLYRVLPEVKEYDDDNGNRRQRLDILIKDGIDMEAFGFELVVEARQTDFDEHCERSKKYAQLHQCSMLMVNICANKNLINYFGPVYENVTTVHVVYDESKGCAELVYKDRKVNLSILSAPWQVMFAEPFYYRE